MEIDFCDVLIVIFLTSAVPILLVGWLVYSVWTWPKEKKLYFPFFWFDLVSPLMCVLLWRNLLNWSSTSKGMDDIYELSIAGGVWALSLLLRMTLPLKMRPIRYAVGVVSFLLPVLIVLWLYF